MLLKGRHSSVNRLASLEPSGLQPRCLDLKQRHGCYSRDSTLDKRDEQYDLLKGFELESTTDTMKYYYITKNKFLNYETRKSQRSWWVSIIARIFEIK